MRSLRAVVIAIAWMVAWVIGCAAPLTVAEPREGGAGSPVPGEFGQTGPLDSGFATDADTFIADPPSDGGED